MNLVLILRKSDLQPDEKHCLKQVKHSKPKGGYWSLTDGDSVWAIANVLGNPW